MVDKWRYPSLIHHYLDMCKDGHLDGYVQVEVREHLKGYVQIGKKDHMKGKLMLYISPPRPHIYAMPRVPPGCNGIF